jgi:DNA-binding NarL/FixJ family response regulator
VAQCGDANDLLLKVDSYPLDIAIVDIRLPPTHSDEGLRAALEISARHPSVACWFVAVLSSIFGKLGIRSTGSESRRVLAVLMFLRG